MKIDRRYYSNFLTAGYHGGGNSIAEHHIGLIKHILKLVQQNHIDNLNWSKKHFQEHQLQNADVSLYLEDILAWLKMLIAKLQNSSSVFAFGEPLNLVILLH